MNMVDDVIFAPYNRTPDQTLNIEGTSLAIFREEGSNIDWETVKSFGEEWNKFHTFKEGEIELIGDDYFDIVPFNQIDEEAYCLDVGCGSGRWAQYLSKRVGKIEAIDPSDAAIVAVKNLRLLKNVRVSIAEVDSLPFPDDTFDLVYSLGVLHHIPDTLKAMKQSVGKVKKGGFFLVYLYYNLDNRGLLFRFFFNISNVIRIKVSKFPSKVKKAICDILAVVIYLPLVGLTRILGKMGLQKLSHKIPLSYYSKTSWTVIRNDALDRFGTPLEQRFSRKDIQQMMESSGLEDIRFSNHPPYWHAIGKKY